MKNKKTVQGKKSKYATKVKNNNQMYGLQRKAKKAETKQ